VVEFDDGLLSNFFWKKDLFPLVSIPFDGKRSRENRLEKTGEIKELPNEKI